VTIEKTSKELKSNLLWSWLAVASGVALGVVSFMTLQCGGDTARNFASIGILASILVATIGAGGIVVTRIKMWWRHG
jgi:hypothetical protein